MQKPGELQKPVRIGGLRKDNATPSFGAYREGDPLCMVCGMTAAQHVVGNGSCVNFPRAPRGDDGPPREDR